MTQEQEENRDEFIDKARELYQTEDVQVDDDAIISMAENPQKGWVSAWVWVDLEE